MRKSERLKTWLFVTSIVVVAMCSTPGCCFLAKVRSVTWPGIHVREEMPLWCISQVKFKTVYFELEEKDATEFSLRMPDGRILRSSQLTSETIAEYLTPFKELTQETHASWADWSIIEYDLGQVRIYFEDDTPTRVNAISYKSFRAGQSVPAIGNRDGSKVFPLPIAEGELIKLFGKPTKSKTYLFNT
jgi:hypothetical protein